MSKYAIAASGLSKQYRVGSLQTPYRTLREAVMEKLTLPRRHKPEASKDGAHHFWALEDVGFEIRKGEVVGVIGRNGAGKSTLLKVLSRITEPTRGWADIQGRIGSLLEVGTGFHGELTGRENIYLNGAILGMKRAQIDRQFDAIVAFAGVERFIDTAVKHYSSGMYLRLAFAVAAHLEPEIMLVDEVLAVGDAAFQKKCLGRMDEVAKEGRTVLFVSHNMGAIRALCTRGLVLHQGRLVEFGSISSAISTYYRLSSEDDRKDASFKRSGFGRVRLTTHQSSTIEQGEPFEVETTMHLEHDAAGFSVYCILEDMNQRLVFHLKEDSTALSDVQNWRGTHRVSVSVPGLWLEPGIYTLYFKVILRSNVQSARYVSDAVHLDVGGAASGVSSVLNPMALWSITASAAADRTELVLQ